MEDEIRLEVSVPTDNEGYVLLQCPNCGTYFKAMPDDIQDEGVLELFCPSCGLVGESYITEDVWELGISIVKNKMMDMLHNECKKMERQFRSGTLTFKVGKHPKHETENPIRSGIEAMESVTMPCCKYTVRVKPILILTGCYCPFCGVKNYDFE